MKLYPYSGRSTVALERSDIILNSGPRDPKFVESAVVLAGLVKGAPMWEPNPKFAQFAEFIAKVEKIANDFYPETDKDAPLALQEMREALEQAVCDAANWNA